MSLTTRGATPAASSTPTSAPPAVRLSNVSKSFKLPHAAYHTLKERALHPFSTRRFDVLRAVDDVSVEIGQGEFFGIVGRNGSGKSTLLKCLAGIYDLDGGTLEVDGRLAPFIELGVGFNPELSARDNAIINGIMLGLTRKQAMARLDQVIAFAELEEFMDLKLKNYSSGMHVRLAFSVAIQVDADILLIDEVLAVGDAAFQQKCFDQFTRLKAEGRTIVFVTHDMGSVGHFCDRAMLMERGRAVALGAPETIVRRYNEVNFAGVHQETSEPGRAEAQRRSTVVDLLAAWFEGPDGEHVFSTPQGDEVCVRLDLRFQTEVADPMFAIALVNDLGQTSFATSTQLQYGSTGRFQAGELATVRIRFQNWLAPGRYLLTASVTRDGVGADAFVLRENVSSILVFAAHSGGGAADLPHSFEIERA